MLAQDMSHPLCSTLLLQYNICTCMWILSNRLRNQFHCHGITVLVLNYPLLYLTIFPEQKSGNAGNLDMPKNSKVLLPNMNIYMMHERLHTLIIVTITSFISTDINYFVYPFYVTLLELFSEKIIYVYCFISDLRHILRILRHPIDEETGFIICYFIIHLFVHILVKW